MVKAKNTKKSAQSAQSKAVSKAAPKAASKAASKTTQSAETTVPTMSVQFDNLLGQLSALRQQLASVTVQVRALGKRAEREVKAANKASRKKRKTGNRQPSGFVKPTKISDELAKFLGKPKGTELARTEVTREINSYIRDHQLQDPQNRRRILPDSKLKKLLKLKSSDELTYFNLQRYMSPHFPKSAAAIAAALAKAQAAPAASA